MKDNMEELQRWHIENGAHTEEAPEGGWALVSDVQEREARLKARIEELEVIVSGKTMYDAAAVAEQRGAERVFAALSVHFAGHPDFDRALADFDQKGLTKEGAADSRSLLDSGEEQKASEPAIYEGYGRKWERVKGTSALREVGDTGPDWDQCVYHMIGGRVQRFLMAEREARPSPSPALEGREDECIRCEPGAVCSSCVVVEGEGGFASAATTNCVPSPGGETDEYAARARGRAESGLPVSQGMVRDGEVVVARAALHALQEGTEK